MIAPTLHTLIHCARPSNRESFAGADAAYAQNGWSVASMLIVFIIMILLVTFIGYFLWNAVVAGAGKNDTGLFTIVKRADSMWQILGLYIVIALLFGGVNSYTPVQPTPSVMA